jgi:hypothetical protein
LRAFWRFSDADDDMVLEAVVRDGRIIATPLGARLLARPIERTEHAHAHVDPQLLRARQLQLLYGRDYTHVEEAIVASDCTLIRDLRNITLAYLAAPLLLLPFPHDTSRRARGQLRGQVHALPGRGHGPGGVEQATVTRAGDDADEEGTVTSRVVAVAGDDADEYDADEYDADEDDADEYDAEDTGVGHAADCDDDTLALFVLVCAARRRRLRR